MTCVECRKNRADQMKELYCENKENCRKAYQDGYNQALEDFANAFIKKVNERMNIEYFYGDDYYSGLEHGYSYSIKIADELLKEKLKK